jgi:hypothetical protein
VHISTFYHDFRFYLKLNSIFGDTDLVPYNIHDKEEYLKNPLDKKIIDKSRKIIQALDQNGDEQDPCFLNSNEVVFLSQEGLITGYDIFDNKEVFNFMDGTYPGVTEKASLNTFMQKGNHILAQNSFIFEQYPDPEDLNSTKCLIAPNNFNKFL